MTYSLPKLPYEAYSLAPAISERTIDFHYGKHEKAYIDNLNEMIKGTEFEDEPLEEIIRRAEGPLFNNAAQAWNHTFFWMCMSPSGGGLPGGRLMSDIVAKWGSFEAFRDAFIAKAAGLWIADGALGIYLAAQCFAGIIL